MRKMLVLLVVMLFLPQMVEAGSPDVFDWIQVINQAQEENNELHRRIQEMQDLLNAANTAPPTPPPAQAPNIRLVQPQSVTITPGETLVVDITVRNIGNAVAHNTLVTAVVAGDYFTIEFLGGSNILGTVAQNANQNVRMQITAAESATAGNYALNVGFAYRTQAGANLSGDDIISVRVDAPVQIAQVMLRDFAINNANILPGQNFTISATLANLGLSAAYNIQVVVADGLASDGIFLSGGQNSPFFQELLPSEEHSISFSFTAAQTATSMAYPLYFEVRSNQAGENVTTQFAFFVTVLAPVGGVPRAYLDVDVSGGGGIFGVGERANITVTVTNSGVLPASNIRIEGAANETDRIVPASASVQMITTLQPGATEILQFAFSPTSAAGSHYHMVGFTVNYHTGVNDEEDSFSQFIGINVYNPEAEENDEEVRTGRPRILVSAYAVDPLIVSAGQEFDLFLTFQNTSSTRMVQNIRVTLAAVEYAENAGAVFTTVGTGNTIFIDQMNPREETQHQLRMFTVPNATPRTYNIEIRFDYEDEDFEPFEEVEQISINVQQVARLEIGNLQIPDVATMFSSAFVDFNIINSGRVPLANLRVMMEGNFDVAGMDIFAGNMGIGNHASFSGDFVPLESGEQEGVLIISGEDQTGSLVEVRHEFVVFVNDGADFSGDDFVWGDDIPWMDATDGDGAGGIPWNMVIIGAGIVGLAVIVTVVMVRKKRRSQDVFEGL
ncbi:MAG: hypothetical protein FWG65_10305 [Turicibacter sp.]|nr:hypothetical protein [Turicibacter sp.]